MLAVDAVYEKGEIHLKERPPVKRCPVIVVFQTDPDVTLKSSDWRMAQAATLQKIWDNEEDAAYDNL